MQQFLVVILVILLLTLPYILKWWFTSSIYGIVVG
jgi:hypothetical protein